MTIRSLLDFQVEKVKVFTTDGLPSLYIKGEDDLLDVIHESKRNEKSVIAAMADEDGTPLFSSYSTMTGRGNGSRRDQDKRPYNLDFKDGISVGPFQNIEKLCLLAEYSDESKMRNALSYYAGQKVGIPYASAYMYTNVYINGEYKGLYGIVTKQEYKKHLQEDGIKAVFELASNDYGLYFNTDHLDHKLVDVRYGDLEYIREMVNALEIALEEKNWDVCYRYIDTDSFARKYALDEFLGNADLGFASQYFYIDSEDMIHCMLPWDYDWTMANSISYYNNKPICEVKAYRFPQCWFTILLEDVHFREAVSEELEEMLTDTFLREMIEHMDEIIGEIAVSRSCDLERWEHAKPYNEFSLSAGLDSFQDYSGLFSDFFYNRRNFLVEYFANIEDYNVIVFNGPQYGNYCIPRGAALWDYLEGATILQSKKTTPAFAGWYTVDGLTPEDIDVVTEDMMFYAGYS